MARVLSTAFCVALLAATAGAFALTQGAKTELIPIYKTHVDKVFSPDCGCATSVAKIDFRLRKKDRLTVWLNHDGERVRTLVQGRTYARGWVRLEFNGIDDSGLTLPQGDYQPVVHVRHRIYTHISPDGDGRNDTFEVHYSVSEPAHGILIVDNHQVEFTRFQPLRGTLTWNGRIDGRLARPGNHVLEISAQDLAGNRTKPFPFAVVTIRYVALGRARVLVRPRGRFAILALSDAPRVAWRIRGRHGVARPGTLHLRAPAKTGVYRVYVTAAGHAAKALVVVG